MGAISFSIDRSAAEYVARECCLTMFVETGTFKGDSIVRIRDLFEIVHSIEIDSDLASAARSRFIDDPAVFIHQGASPAGIASLLSCGGIPSDGIFWWLDAHWCEFGGSGSEGQCPLLEEIASIRVLGAKSVIAIDDARLFLAPPTSVHRLRDWPAFDDVLNQIRKTAPLHRISVINDVIWVIPADAESEFLDFSAKSAVDWLSIAEKSRTYDVVAIQLGEKDREIIFLTHENELRLEAINSTNAEAQARLDIIGRANAERESLAQRVVQLESLLAQSSDRSAHYEMLERHIANLNVAVAETEAQASAQGERVTMLEGVAQERMDLIIRLDAGLREANADRAAQAETIGGLRRRIDELDLHLVHLNTTLAETTAHAVSQTERAIMLEGVTRDRADLIARLDAHLRDANIGTTGQAEMMGNLRARIAEFDRQFASLSVAITEAEVRAVTEAERATMFEGVAQERMDLITRLDAGLRETNTERAIQAEMIGGLRRRIDELDMHLGQLNKTVAETTAHAVSQTERANMLEGVTQDRADLIVRLDGHLRDANVGTTGQAEMMGSLRARIAELEHHVAHVNAAVAETTAHAVGQGERAAMLESVAQERATLIERLDGIARESSCRAAAAEAVRIHLEREVVEQRALVAAAYAQAADLAGASTEAAARAEAAERERDARLVVIEELVRTRDALLAALKPGHHRTGWLSRFFSH